MHAIHVNQNTSPNWYQFMLLKICPHCWWFRNRSNQLIWRIYHYLQDFTSQMVQDFFHQQFQKILIHTLNIRTLGWRVQVFHRGKSRRFIYFFFGCLASFSKSFRFATVFWVWQYRQQLGTNVAKWFYNMYMEHTKTKRERDFEMQKVCHIHVDVSVFIKRNQSGGIKGYPP